MSDLRRVMYTAAAVCIGLMFMFFTMMTKTENDLFRILGTIMMMGGYHLIIRLFISNLVGRIPLDAFDPDEPRFRELPFERRLYGLLRVKKWKAGVPTYDISEFSPVYHTFGELARTTCRAETSHWLCVLASLVTLCFSAWFGDFPVFLVTALAGALVDLMFIVIQRYNRPRMARLAERREHVY